MAEGNGRRFVVQLPGVVRDQYLVALRQARQTGQHALATQAMLTVGRRLQSNAAHAGEPVRYLAQMRQTIRKLAVAPLYVEYVVHDTAPLVVFRRVVLMTG